jgi:hypothetical protein
VIAAAFVGGERPRKAAPVPYAPIRGAADPGWCGGRANAGSPRGDPACSGVQGVVILLGATQRAGAAQQRVHPTLLAQPRTWARLFQALFVASFPRHDGGQWRG